MRSRFLRAVQPAGAAPDNPFTLVGSSTVGTATSGTTISVDIPDGTAAGDFILVVHAARSSADLNMQLSDASYTTIADLYANDSFDSNLGVHWKIADGTETSLSLPGGAGFIVATCAVQVFRGVNQSSPLDAAPVTSVGINDGQAVNPGITAASTGCLIIAAAAVMTGSGDVMVTPPDGFLAEDIAPYYEGSSFPTRAAIASKEVSAAGFAGGGVWSHAFTSTLQSWTACTLALRPA